MDGNREGPNPRGGSSGGEDHGEDPESQLPRSGFDGDEYYYVTADSEDGFDQDLEDRIAQWIEEDVRRSNADSEETRYRDAWYNFHEQVLALNAKYALAVIRGKTRIVKNVITPDGVRDIELMTAADFRLEHSANLIKHPDQRKKLPAADLWLRHPDHRQFEGITFMPGRETPGWYNLWTGYSVEPHAGDCGLVKQHVLENLANGSGEAFRYLWAWAADLVRNPGSPPGIGLLLRGGKGVGKSIWGEILGSLVREHYVAVDHHDLVFRRFNAHLTSCLLLQIDDATLTGERGSWGRLNSLVTARRRLVEFKGVDVVQLPWCGRLLVTGNENWLVPASFDERRWAAFDVGDGWRRRPEMFAAMMRQLDDGGRAALLFDLLHHGDASIDLRCPPVTAALAEQKTATMDSDAKWWHDVLCEGSQTLDGTWHRVISGNALFEAYVGHSEQIGRRERSLRTALGIALARLCLSARRGYAPAGAAARLSRQDGPRPWCYIFPDLAVARGEFEAAIGHPIDWPAGETAQSRE